MKQYLLDTNILIYYLADEIPLLQLPEIEEMLNYSFRISIITRIELLGWKNM
ncbi:MAG: putative ribonuclease VapC [Methanomicrobiales archaeon 53_19]|nr:MAG: putative ribonuclease VapC [Methanocalculus sp. 52_23]KUK99794.1 MAG: putative ribonuclease VapC [Methanomicrobiales archaeon 53_19]HIJ07286.1 type II toxin-antitoxin system VapC family toxin [Methanocalculus sp.]